jgi:hypothetical protein
MTSLTIEWGKGKCPSLRRPKCHCVCLTNFFPVYTYSYAERQDKYVEPTNGRFMKLMVYTHIFKPTKAYSSFYAVNYEAFYGSITATTSTRHIRVIVLSRRLKAERNLFHIRLDIGTITSSVPTS